MRRFPNEQIRVRLTPDRTAPAAFWRGNQSYQIQRVQSYWRLAGAWWDGEGEKSYFRVIAGHGVYELCLDHATNKWTLVGIHD